MKRPTMPFRLLFDTAVFEVANLFTLFRLTWLPLMLLLGAQVALGQALAAIVGNTNEEVLIDSPLNSLAFYASLALQTIALSVVAVRVHRLVLFNDARPGEYFGFPFGRTEVWYVAMVALTMVAAIALAIALWKGVNFVGETTGGWKFAPFPQTLAAVQSWPFLRSVALVLLIMAAVMIWMWFFLRMALWPPSVVANNGLSLVDAWRATRGQAWALFFLLFMPGQVLVFVLMMASFWTDDPASGMRLTNDIGERHTLFGGYINPGVATYGVMPSPERLAIDFGLMFGMTTFMAALLSFAYVWTKEHRALS